MICRVVYATLEVSTCLWWMSVTVDETRALYVYCLLGACDKHVTNAERSDDE